MKMAVVGANGRAGKLIVEEAVRRGIDVTAIVREANKTAAAKSLAKGATELEAGDLAGFDVVVDAVGGWTPNPRKLRLLSARIAPAMPNVKLIKIGPVMLGSR